MSRLNHVKAHLPVIIDYLGLGTPCPLLPPDPLFCPFAFYPAVSFPWVSPALVNPWANGYLAAGIALIVYSSKTIVDDRASPILAIIYSSLVLGHFLVPIGRRTPVLYGTLLIVGIVSTVFYAVGTNP
jgi:hypothetical protein